MSTKLLSAKEALKIKPDLNDKSNMYDGLIEEFNNIVTTARKENLNEFSFDLNIVYPNDACIFEYELKMQAIVLLESIMSRPHMFIHIQ